MCFIDSLVLLFRYLDDSSHVYLSSLQIYIQFPLSPTTKQSKTSHNNNNAQQQKPQSTDDFLIINKN